MIIYGLGAALIFFTLALMYFIAFSRRESLELNTLETFDTRSSMIENIIMGCIPLLSVVVSIIGYEHRQIFSIAGFVYWFYAILMPIFGTINAKKKRKLITQMEEQDHS